jgi:hypothetical protein
MPEFGITFLYRIEEGYEFLSTKVRVTAEDRAGAYAEAKAYANAQNWFFYKIWGVTQIS